MPRRRLRSLEDYDRAIRNGFGVGSKADYTPWLRVQDIPSSGRSSKISSLLFPNREHHYLSDGETRFHFFNEFDQTVVDIREQFPILPLEFTMRIANKVGIKHPRVRGTKTPAVMTIDSLVTRQFGKEDKYTAYSIKQAADLKQRRTAGLLELQRLCCAAIGVPWYLVTKESINVSAYKNLDWASFPLRGVNAEVSPVLRDQGLVEAAKSLLPIGISTVADTVDRLSVELSLEESEANKLFRSMIWKREIDVDLTKTIQSSGRVNILSISSVSNEACNELAS